MPRTRFHPVQLLISRDDEHHCELPFDQLDVLIGDLLSQKARAVVQELRSISNTPMPIKAEASVQGKYPLVAYLHRFEWSKNGALIPHTIAMFERLAQQKEDGWLNKSALKEILQSANTLTSHYIFIEWDVAVAKFKAEGLEGLATQLFSVDRFPNEQQRLEYLESYLALQPLLNLPSQPCVTSELEEVRKAKKKGLLFGLGPLASEYGRDAIPFEVARSGIQNALTYEPTSRNQKLVAQCWLLSIMLMRPFEQVFRVRYSHGPDGNLLGIRVDKSGICRVSLSHPEFLDLALDLGSECKAGSLNADLIFRLPKFDWSDKELNIHRPIALSNGLAAAEKTALASLYRLLKDDQPNYVTERSIRTCSIQRLIINSADPALAQMKTGDRLGLSESMLSYRGFSLNHVYFHWWSTVEEITGEKIALDLPGPMPLWGPPKSYASLSIIPRVTHAANALLEAADNAISLKERYHFLIHGVLIRLHLESGLRVTRETRKVSRSQISVASGLVMTGDKKVHATSLERIAVISNDLCRRVCEIIDLQRRLLKQSSDKSDKQILQAAIDGTGPLFAPLAGNRRLLSGSEHLKTLSELRNPHRHYLSTILSLYVAPQLVEFQLGHLNGAPLSGPEGTLSLTDLQRLLSPYLEKLFVERKSTQPIFGEIATKEKFRFLSRSSEERRRIALQQLLKPDESVPESTFDLHDIPRRPQCLAVEMDKQLSNTLVPGESNATVVRHAIYQIAEHSHFDDRIIHEACYRLYQRLTRRFENQGVDRMGLWSLLNQGTAPLVNASNLAASDTLFALRQALDPRLLSQEEINDSIPILLMLFSDCPSIEIALELLTNKGSLKKLRCDEFATVERTDEFGTELFYLNGPALSAYSLWLAHNGQTPEVAKTSAYLASRFGLDISDLENLCYAERLLVHPEAIAKVLSDRAPYREANWDQDVRWRFNIASSSTALVRSRLQDVSDQPKGERKSKRPTQALSQIQKAINVSRDCPEKLRAELARLSRVQPGNETFRLLSEWCVELFKPGSNLRKPNSKYGLARSTVKQYAGSVGKLLFQIEEEMGEPITDIPPETLSEVIEELFHREDSKDFDAKKMAVLQRFFASSGLPVPCLNIERTERAPPRARLINDVTLELAISSINGLSKRTDLTANPHALCIEGVSLLAAMSASGARTNEIKHLEPKHIRETDVVGCVFIKPSERRSLKTQGSQRFIRLPLGTIGKDGFPLMSNPTGFGLFESLLSASLQLHSSSDVLKYDLRHRYANKKFDEAMEINDPYRRALALRELSLSMGHHGLQTTVTYYIHRVRAHSHNRYQAMLEPSIKSRCSLKRESQVSLKNGRDWPCFGELTTKLPSAPKGRPPKLNSLIPKASKSLKKLQLIRFIKLLNDRMAPKYAALHLGIDGESCKAIVRWIEQHFDVCPKGIHWVSSEETDAEFWPSEGRQSPWSESVFEKEVRALKSSTMPHILLNELWTALRNRALHLKINTHQHAQVINQMLASCGTTMRLVGSERNPNRYYLSIAGSVPTDAAARVVLRMALLTQVIFADLQRSPRFQPVNPYFQECDRSS